MKTRNKLFSLSAIILCGGLFSGCGSSDSTTPNTSTNIEVERGKIYDANVTDSSTPPLVATMTVGSNIYTFSKTPTYPITASGGWIDVDSDGNMTAGIDVVLDLNLTSYSANITPVTTYLGDITSTAGKARLDKLISDMNVTENELLKVPSKSSKNEIIIQNAIYNIMKTNNTTNIHNRFNDINTSFSTLKTYLDGDPSKTTAAQIALFVEAKIVSDLFTNGDITKLDSSKISAIEAKRDGSTPSSSAITHNGISYNAVTSPYTSRIWLDRNLGASQVCAEKNDELCYGDYYQWGRNTDGHEKANSTTSTTQAANYAVAGDKFIINVDDWAGNDTTGASRNINWGDVTHNTICPTGYKVPTKNELKAETINITGANDVNSSDTAFANFLKLPVAGTRDGTTGVIGDKGVSARIWSSSVEEMNANFYEMNALRFNATNAEIQYYNVEELDQGNSVRCIKETVNASISGKLVDPYIVGAILCQDTNDDKVCGSDEPTSTATTATGDFTFNQSLTAGKNVIIKTHGLHDGKTFDLNISGVVTSSKTISIISPLTTFQSKGLTNIQLTNILDKAKADAVTIDSASNLGSFVTDHHTIFNDPLSGGLMDKKVSEITNTDLVNIQASLTAYGLIKIMNGSATLKALNGSELETSGRTTGSPVNLIARTVLKTISDNIRIGMLQQLGTLFTGESNSVRSGLILAHLPADTATTAIPEPKMGLLIQIAVKIIDDLAQLGYATCNATSGDAATKVTAALTAIGIKAPKIVTNINNMGAIMYGFRNKNIINSTLPSPYLSALKSNSPDMAIGFEANSTVTTFVFNNDGNVTAYLGDN